MEDNRQLNHQHFKLYKPFGMLSQISSNDKKEARNKLFLSALYEFPNGSMPIGRLDEKSEGLLLMTTSGKLSDYINRSGVEKEYYAQLDGKITTEALARLQYGVEIGLRGIKYKTRNCTVKRIDTPETIPEPHTSLRIGRHRPSSWISITLREGKFRQVRKMTAAVGYPTLRLVRVRIGTIFLDGLPPGGVTTVSNLTILKRTI